MAKTQESNDDNERARTTLTLRLTRDEYHRIQGVAQHHGLTMSSAVRLLFAREAREIGLATR